MYASRQAGRLGNRKAVFRGVVAKQTRLISKQEIKPMQTTELIGIAIFAAVILIATAQVAFAYGRQVATNTERLRADKRVQGVLKSVNKSRPSRRLTYRKVNPRTVGKQRYLNSRLPGEVLA